MTDNGVVTVRSRYSFAETVERLESALRAHGIKVFAAIDQRSEAAAAGLEMPPMVLILFGNPKGGTALMVSRPLSGLDLPLKVLVSEASPGEVLVAFNRARYVIERHALPDELAANIAPVERVLASAVTT